MAVTVTDRRTTQNSAESTTGWTGAGFGVTTTSAEGTNAVAEGFNIATGQIYHTGTSRNLGTSPGTLVYIWAFNNALQGNWDASPPPNALMLGDGTDRIGFDMAGQNRRVFNHLEGPSGSDINGWQCLVLDTAQASTMNSAGNTYVVNGSFAGLNFAAITEFGVSFDTLSKALGGGYNCAVDIIRFGNDGIRVTGGTTGDRGSFLEVATEDRSRATGKAHGIIRELGTGVYGTQGPITFGGPTQTSWFDADGVVLVFANRNIANDKYYLDVEGGTGATHFLLANSTIKSAGPFVTCNFTQGGATNIDTFDLNAVVFSALGNAITFGNDATHSIASCTFDLCGQVDPGTTTFTGNTISNSTNADGAILIDGDGTANISDLSLISDGTGYGARFTATGTYTLTDWSFSGYGADSTTNAAIVNASGGLVTLNVSGGDTPTVNNLTTSSTVVNNFIDFTLTGLQWDSEVRIYRVSDDVQVYGVEGVTGPLDRAGSSDGTSNGSTTFTSTNTTFVSGDVGKVLTITSSTTAPENVGNYRITGFTDSNTITLEKAVPGTASDNIFDITTETSPVSTTYQYNYTADVPVYIHIHHVDYVFIRLELTLTNGDRSVPIQQRFDRNYSNPI